MSTLDMKPTCCICCTSLDSRYIVIIIAAITIISVNATHEPNMLYLLYEFGQQVHLHYYCQHHNHHQHHWKHLDSRDIIIILAAVIISISITGNLWTAGIQSLFLLLSSSSSASLETFGQQGYNHYSCCCHHQHHWTWTKHAASAVWVSTTGTSSLLSPSSSASASTLDRSLVAVDSRGASVGPTWMVLVPHSTRQHNTDLQTALFLDAFSSPPPPSSPPPAPRYRTVCLLTSLWSPP